MTVNVVTTSKIEVNLSKAHGKEIMKALYIAVWGKPNWELFPDTKWLDFDWEDFLTKADLIVGSGDLSPEARGELASLSEDVLYTSEAPVTVYNIQ